MKRASTLDEKRVIAGEYCKNDCRVVNYNINCVKCSLTKYILSIVPSVEPDENGLLPWEDGYKERS